MVINAGAVGDLLLSGFWSERRGINPGSAMDLFGFWSERRGYFSSSTAEGISKVVLEDGVELGKSKVGLEIPRQ